MFKSIKINAAVLALIAGMVLATGAQAAGPTAKTGAQASGPIAKIEITPAEEIQKATKNYRKDRSDYARDMVHLHRADTGNALSRRHGPFASKISNTEINSMYTNEVMFNTQRAPLETLREEGIANQLNNAATRQEWTFSARTPQDFRNKFGAPAYTAIRAHGYCYPEISVSIAALMPAAMEFETYIDVDKDGNALEIYVTTCKVLDGYAKGTSLIQSISPVMKGTSFINKFADKEKIVLSHRR